MACSLGAYNLTIVRRAFTGSGVGRFPVNCCYFRNAHTDFEIPYASGRKISFLTLNISDEEVTFTVIQVSLKNKLMKNKMWAVCFYTVFD